MTKISTVILLALAVASCYRKAPAIPAPYRAHEQTLCMSCWIGQFTGDVYCSRLMPRIDADAETMIGSGRGTAVVKTICPEPPLEKIKVSTKGRRKTSSREER